MWPLWPIWPTVSAPAGPRHSVRGKLNPTSGQASLSDNGDRGELVVLSCLSWITPDTLSQSLWASIGQTLVRWVRDWSPIGWDYCWLRNDNSSEIPSKYDDILERFHWQIFSSLFQAPVLSLCLTVKINVFEHHFTRQTMMSSHRQRTEILTTDQCCLNDVVVNFNLISSEIGSQSPSGGYSLTFRSN